MNIGIDFDNTIVRYDFLFRDVAQKEKILEKSFNGNTKMPKGWISHSQKQGYFFLLSHNDDYTRFGVIYCFVPLNAWERAGPRWKLELSAVAELKDKKVLCGQIKKDKHGNYHLFLDTPKLGE